MSLSTSAFGARILIVDDQESNARLLELALRRGGYLAVTSTTQPQDVCPLHRENRYDLILLDLQMPRMNGFEVLAALADETPVDVLVLSADPAQEARCLQAGAKGFLSKPFVLAEVLARVALIVAFPLPLPVEEEDEELKRATANSATALVETYVNLTSFRARPLSFRWP